MHHWLALITPLTEQDAPDMYALEQAMLATLPSPRWYYTSTQEEFAQQARAGHAWGIRMEGRLIAMNILLPSWEAHDGGYPQKLGLDDPRSMNFEDVIVDEAWRRQGIHHAFLRRSVQQASAWGCTTIYATVDPDNLPSLRAFERFGFQVIAQQPTYDGRPRCFLRLAL